MANDLKKICGQFMFEGIFESAEPYGDGHINDTYIVTCSDDNDEEIHYILQRVNHLIFTATEELMENIENITSYLSDIIKDSELEDYQVLTLIKTVSGHSFYKTDEGHYFRAYVFVENATGHTFAENNELLYSAGKAFGEFQLLLKDYPVHNLHETIKDFHNTPKRFERFQTVLEEDKLSRKAECMDAIQFVLDRKAFTTLIVDQLSSGDIPIRVTHNDTKLNNVLIDNETLIGKCVIDLDTVMPGSALYDFGDAIRSCGSTVAEDEENLSLLSFDIERFTAYTKGFLESMGHELSEKEIEYLPDAAILMTFECGMRFLTDHLEGDQYFKIHKDNHNLIRAKNQFKFVEVMEKNRVNMLQIVDSLRKQ